MTAMETLLAASIELAQLRQENRILRNENARLRREPTRTEFDLSADDLPAFHKRQIGPTS